MPQLELEVEEDLVRQANEERWGGRGASDLNGDSFLPEVDQGMARTSGNPEG